MAMAMAMGWIEPRQVAAKMLKSRHQIRQLAAVSLVLTLSMGALGGEWAQKGSVTYSGVYTDNVGLRDKGKDGEFINVVRPSFELIGKGRRAEMSLAAAFEFNDVGSGADAFNPRIKGDGKVEVLEDFFFIEGDVYSNQSMIDPFAAGGESSLNKTDNHTTTYDYSVSPYIVHRFGQTAEYQLRYTFDDQINKSDELSDSSHEIVLMTLKSGPEFGRISWGLTNEYNKTEFDGDGEGSLNQSGDNERLSSSVNIGYRLTEQWQVNGTLGKEWNNYQTYDDDDTDDQFWDVGVLWTPTRRTTFDVGYGKHFYSTTPRFKFTHKHRRSALSVSYARTLSDTRSERRNAEFFSFLDALGDLVDPITGEPLFLTDNFTFQDQGVFINEKFDSEWTLKGKRTSLTLFLKESKQIREDVDSDAVFKSTGIRLKRDLSSVLSVTSRLSWDERENRQANQADTTRFYLSVDRELGPKTKLGIAYSFSDRDSELSSDNYKENRVSVSLTIDF